MTEVPLEYQEAVDTYEPIDFEGIKLYPIKVREYTAYMNARPALDFLQQSLPVRFISMPLLSAFYKMDVENRMEGKPSDGLFYRAVLFLILSTRFQEELSLEERIRNMTFLVSSEDHSILKEIKFEQGGEEKTITPVLFQRMRPILAAQNGIELVSTDANPELVEAERDLADLNGPELDADLSSLISAVAALSHADEKEIYDWPILKLHRRRDSYLRVLQFLLCGIAVSNGAQYKGGNPVPDPFFRRSNRNSGALIDMNAITKGNTVSVSESAPAGFQN